MAFKLNSEQESGAGVDVNLEGLSGIDYFLYKLKKTIQSTASAFGANAKRVAQDVKEMVEALDDGMDGAENLTGSLKKTASATAKITRRILADFDELNRLGRITGGSSYVSGGFSVSIAEAEKLSEVLQVLTDRIKETLTAMEIASAAGLASFYRAVESGFQVLRTVETMVGNLLGCIVADFATSWGTIWSSLSGTAARLNEKVIQPVLSAITAFTSMGWNTVRGVWAGAYAWFGGYVTQPIESLFSRLWMSVSNSAGNGLARMQSLLSELTVWVGSNVIRHLEALFTQLWQNISNGAVQTADGIKAFFSAAILTLGATFREVWASVIKAFSVNGSVFVDIQDGTESVFKTLLNDLIRGLNTVLQTSIGGLNYALLSLKNTEIQGQRPFFGLKTVLAPQIPYLAQGAVLPANRPFLAMVGDQKHGTNVEAPLSTIQEALALAMEELGAGADQGKILEVLRQILQAVSGIRIGDEVIGQAAARYNRKMAVVRGGRV